MKFVEFLARRVVALQEKLGPGVTSVPLESESNDQSASTKQGRSSSASPARQSPPPSRHGSPSSSRHGSPTQTDPAKKVPTPSGAKVVFSPHSQNSLSLWAQMDLSDGDVEDTFSDEEKEGKRQAPLPAPGKRPHDSSDDEKSPSKKTKVDVSDLYGTATKLDKGKGDGGLTDAEESKTSKPKKAKKNKKKKNKKSKKNKKEKSDKKESDKKKTEKSPEDKTPEKKSELKMPEKTRCNASDGENSETTVMPKSKKKPIRSVQEC